MDTDALLIELIEALQVQTEAINNLAESNQQIIHYLTEHDD